MIKTFYCHQGMCGHQCKVVVSNPIAVYLKPKICLYHDVNDTENLEPIWKEESYVENIPDQESKEELDG